METALKAKRSLAVASLLSFLLCLLAGTASADLVGLMFTGTDSVSGLPVTGAFKYDPAQFALNVSASVTTNGGAATIEAKVIVNGTTFCCKDLGGDGKADIVWRNASGEVYVWLMNGLGISSQGPVETVGTDWQIAGVGDFNGDGKADIVWRNASGEVYVWLMNGLGISSRGSLGIIGSDWEIQGVGDFNGDGNADIVWRSISTGEVYIWLMNGLGISSQGSVGVIGNDWYIE